MHTNAVRLHLNSYWCHKLNCVTSDKDIIVGVMKIKVYIIVRQTEGMRMRTAYRA